MSLITRQGKGSKLTIEEMDNNLLYLESLSGTSSTSIIPLSKTVWVNLDLTENNETQRIFKTYDEAVAWILANDTPSEINQWQIILPGGLVPALSIYPWIRISGMNGTTIEKVDTTVIYSTSADIFSAIIQNAQILELNVTTENSTLALMNCTVTNTVSNGLTSECIMFVSDCLFLGGDFISYNFYNCKNTQFMAHSSITNCWGAFHNCTGMAIGDVSGKTTYVVDGLATIRSKIYGTVSIVNAYIDHSSTTTLQPGSDVKMHSVFASPLTITVPISATLLTEVVNPNITVVTPEGHPEVWTHNGEKYNNANSRLASTDVDSAITELATVKAIPITYADLIALRDASKLIPGQNYLISDFAQSYNIFDGGTMNIEEEQVGIGEVLIVTAASTNSIYKEAISSMYPKDTIHYSLDLLDDRDIGFGDGAGTPCANFKGMIYYRKDTVQNVETHYDFRNVKFRRWAVDAVAYDNGTAYVAKDVCKSVVDGKIYKCITDTTGEGDPTVNTTDWILWLDITADAFVSWTADKTLFDIGDITTDNLIINNVTAGVDYDDFTTFGDYYNWVKNVSIGMINLELAIGKFGSATILLSQKVFKTTDNPATCFSMTFGDNNLPMTFGTGNNSMTFGNDNYSMTFGKSNNLMTFGNNNSSMIFENYNRSMTFGNDNSSMIFGTDNRSYSNRSMTFGNNNNSMTFGKSNNSMTFGNDNYLMTFGNDNSSMTFGDNTNPENRMITFGDDTTMCVFEHSCFTGLAADLDLTAATHIRGAYNTTIYQDAADGVKLSYMDGGVMQIVAVTD
ncbi:hypothetical protein M0Q97_11160 [Candidatus Dojkabacteria bacterium]|jgi:hypothetical protein|nr:hypothetical protein [Candidatus Dojkabacteria bacterium]